MLIRCLIPVWGMVLVLRRCPTALRFETGIIIYNLIFVITLIKIFHHETLIDFCNFITNY